jgi:hypothetical protein
VVLNLDELHWRPRGEWVTAAIYRSNRRATELRRSLGGHYGSYRCDKLPKAWRPHGERRTRRWLPHDHVACVYWWTIKHTVHSSLSATRSFTSWSLSSFNSAWITMIAQICARGRRRRGIWAGDPIRLLYPREASSVGLTEHAWDQFCSIFYVMTQPLLYIKDEAW